MSRSASKDRAWREANREHLKDYQKTYLAANPEKVVGYRLKRKFGITLDDYKKLLAAQDGKCAICRRVPEDKPHHRWLAVDHDHKTGKIRGLLCFHCNTGLGNLRDDPAVLQRAIEYLSHD